MQAKEARDMREKKYYLALDDYEKGIIIRSLNNLRNSLLANGQCTDAVDDVIIKIANAPVKKFKVQRTEG